MNSRKGMLITAIILIGVTAWYFLRPASLVVEEDWQMDVASATAPSTSLNADIQTLVDKVALPDGMEASKAWIEIGARYRSSQQFLQEAGPALWDQRPVSFELVKEIFSGGGNTFTYFAVRNPS